MFSTMLINHRSITTSGKIIHDAHSLNIILSEKRDAVESAPLLNLHFSSVTMTVISSVKFPD